jgi:hypothetical protein
MRSATSLAFIVALVMIGSPAWCGGDPYTDAMADGARLEKKHDYKGAVQAFERAVAARPDDAGALSELGWAAFLAGDLARASDATQRAVAAAKESNQKAAALYNLGRISEQKGDKAKAADSYRQSLALRPNATVEARLKSLSAADPLAPQPLAGPFVTIEAFCTAAKPDRCFLEGPALSKPTAPWSAARLIQTGAPDDRAVRLAIRAGTGWFVTRPSGETSPDVAPIEVKSEGRALTARWVQGWVAADRPDAVRWAQHCTEKLMVCGVGATGRPSCTPAISVRDGGCKSADQPASIEWDWTLDVHLLSDGKLQVGGKTGAPPKEAKSLVGVHTLAFP